MTDQDPREATVREALLPSADEVAGILRPDHPGVPRWEQRSQALEALDSLARDARKAALAEAVVKDLAKLNWREEVDVNGEYTTERWRPSYAMKTEVDRIVAEFPAEPRDTTTPAWRPSVSPFHVPFPPLPRRGAVTDPAEPRDTTETT